MEPGALPLLSHALFETWQRREGNRLTLAGYAEAGGVQHIIARTAELIYSNLNPDQQRLAKKIFFVQPTRLGDGIPDSRRRVDYEELISIPGLG